MLRLKKIFVVHCLLIGLVMMPFASLAATYDENGEEIKSGPEVMTVDILLVRPLGLVSMVCGSVIFLVSSPFSALGGNTREAWDRLVVDPTKFTFDRPLGHFEQ